MIGVWFVRSNGVTVHADPGTPNFVPGEPEGSLNYRAKCLREGFARIGWPNTGDLRDTGKGRLAPNGYTLHSLSRDHVRLYLEKFASIQVGDVVLIPADCGKFRVHLGMAVRRSGENREIVNLAPGGSAYYYVSALPFECAHRVDVKWAADEHGDFRIVELPDLGGNWFRAFGEVKRGRERAIILAREFGLPVAPLPELESAQGVQSAF